MRAYPCDIKQLLDQLADQLKHSINNGTLAAPLMVGIHSGGVWVANQLHQRLQLTEQLGLLDITFYRDDFSQAGLHPQVKRSELPFDVDNRNIILVDDVLYTGRTIRAALNEIFDYGRPAHVCLVALLVRNGRQLPIQADFTGLSLDLEGNERIKLSGPDPLKLVIENVLPDSSVNNR
ncbi:MAG TPA: bifunctional pyr operon transcriptional regulator/uracil phosphoribosyltransferase PyrR [Crenotrichaceae bacterium]|nr:bifunctional pyr operon transcriptional regulator/uracil phosphoribosyltransferase PyrR [Crenotrichaceae bacterium]